jgi:hypothetical protein
MDKSMQELSGGISEKRGASPLAAIGIFLSVFGVAVISGIMFTDSSRGKLVNLMCGGILLSIGLLAFFKGRKPEN